MSPLLGQSNREPRDRTLLTLGIVMAILLAALLVMPFIANARSDIPSRGLTSHSTASAV